MADIPQELLKDWIRRRADAVRSKYSAFDALMELGVEGISDEETSVGVFCPFHVNVNTPAARYYPAGGRNRGYLRCYACRQNWDSINIYAQARGKRFMEALLDLERRYRIQIPKKPDAPDFIEHVERGSAYESDQWHDIPRFLKLLEGKLKRIRDKTELSEYVKFCRVLDRVDADFEKLGKGTPDMTRILKKVMSRMDEAVIISEMQDNPTEDAPSSS